MLKLNQGKAINMSNKIKAVFFDCWDTVISFKEKNKHWNTQALKHHCLNLSDVSFEEVEAYAQKFLKGYYMSFSNYEITAKQFLTLLCRNFDLKLDCPISQCTHEILTNLDPQMIPGLDSFLRYLESNGLYYAILSNTIYDEKDTLDIINKLVSPNRFRFFLGSADIGVKKPNPDFFLTGLKMAGFKPEEAVYVGDSLFADVYGSNKAGFKKSIWLNLKNQNPDNFEHVPEKDKLEYINCHSYQEVIQAFKDQKL
jgi:FMN phosphatase YigB (HAD superfamily)